MKVILKEIKKILTENKNKPEFADAVIEFVELKMDLTLAGVEVVDF